MGTGTWVLANAACVLSAIQQQGFVSMQHVTNRPCKSLKYKDKTFVKRFVTKHCLSCKGLFISIVRIGILNGKDLDLYI